MLNRRELIRNGAIAVAVVSGVVPGMRTAVARASRIRRNVNEMAPWHPDLMALREYVEIARARPVGHPAGWRAFAALHGEGGEFGICQHQNWFFLPWHRAYLLMYETAVAAETRYNEFALPYWDWTHCRTYPTAFSDRTFNGRPNALYSPGVGDEGATPRAPSLNLPDSAVGPGTMKSIMAEPDFELWASSRPVDNTVTPPRPQDSISPAWLDRTGTVGRLEEVPHNQVHLLSGGFMATAASARDPLFQVHHCNVDRLWTRWNAGGGRNPYERIWTDMVFPNHFISSDGRRYSVRVGDMANMAGLGYVYDDASIAAAPVATPDPARAPRVQALLSGVGSVDGLRRISTRLVPPADKRNMPSPQVELTLSDADRARFPSGSVIAVIRDVHTRGAVQGMRIFVNLDHAASEAPDDDPHFVTSIAFLGGTHMHAGHRRGPPSFAVDLTATLRVLAERNLLRSDRVTLQLVPLFAVGAEADAAAALLPASVDVGIL